MSSSWWSQFAYEPACWSLCTVQWGLPTLAYQKHFTAYEAVSTGLDADGMCSSLFTAATPAQPRKDRHNVPMPRYSSMQWEHPWSG